MIRHLLVIIFSGSQSAVYRLNVLYNGEREKRQS